MPTISPRPAPPRRLSRFLPRRLKWSTIASAIVLIVLALAMLFPQALTTQDPLALSVRDRLQPPSAAHWFGTDGTGRDVYSRMIYGARYSVGMALIIVLSAALIGALVGGLAGFGGGWIDQSMMRVVDIFLAFPYFILALAIASALGRGMGTAVLALTLVWWPSYARMIRGQVLSIKQNVFVDAARAVGVPNHSLILRHILPHTTNEMNVRITLDLGYVILALTGLSFLGLGAQNPTPEWGLIVSDARLFVFRAWWYAVLPGLVIFVTVLAFVILGDAFTERRFRS
ncbi:MAG: ABC transporter permease [Anaerolineae bacterium]